MSFLLKEVHLQRDRRAGGASLGRFYKVKRWLDGEFWQAKSMKLQPTPAQAMALSASGLLDVDDFPDVAAQWLADGMDSESLRMLAGADHEDRADIRDRARKLLDAYLQLRQPIASTPAGSIAADIRSTHWAAIEANRDREIRREWAHALLKTRTEADMLLSQEPRPELVDHWNRLTGSHERSGQRMRRSK